MEYKNDNLEELLAYIDPAGCSYQEWGGIGRGAPAGEIKTQA